MSIVIEFIANTNYEIQIWIIKTCCCKLYTHKTKEHKILKKPKKEKVQNAKTQKTN
jgi:hypothetical protein